MTPPVARFMIVEPLVKVKPVESDALGSDWNLHDVRAYLFIEHALTHTQIIRCVSQSNYAGLWSIPTWGHASTPERRVAESGEL
jgi:hypothetical protein